MSAMVIGGGQPEVWAPAAVAERWTYEDTIRAIAREEGFACEIDGPRVAGPGRYDVRVDAPAAVCTRISMRLLDVMPLDLYVHVAGHAA